MTTYQTIPIEVEAIQFTRNNWDEVLSFTNNKAHGMEIVQKKITEWQYAL